MSISAIPNLPSIVVFLIMMLIVLLVVIIGLARSMREKSGEDAEEASGEYDEIEIEPESTSVEREPAISPDGTDTTTHDEEPHKGTRVVMSVPSSKNAKKDKALTPEEAEFKQILVWEPDKNNRRICMFCGAEMERAASTCQACGKTNSTIAPGMR